MQVKANVSIDRPFFHEGILVEHLTTKEVGIVTTVTKRWVHVTWLAACDHDHGHYKRAVLGICPIGTKVTVKQV